MYTFLVSRDIQTINVFLQSGMLLACLSVRGLLKHNKNKSWWRDICINKSTKNIAGSGVAGVFAYIL